MAISEIANDFIAVDENKSIDGLDKVATITCNNKKRYTPDELVALAEIPLKYVITHLRNR